MKRLSIVFAPTLLLAWGLTVGLPGVASAQAQQTSDSEKADPPQQPSWYYGSQTPSAPQRSIAQQKSAERARQRLARLDALRWAGYSVSRPTSTAIPFTSTYNRTKLRVGGWPFAWHSGGRPGVLLTQPRFYYY